MTDITLEAERGDFVIYPHPSCKGVPLKPAELRLRIARAYRKDHNKFRVHIRSTSDLDRDLLAIHCDFDGVHIERRVTVIRRVLETAFSEDEN